MKRKLSAKRRTLLHNYTHSGHPHPLLSSSVNTSGNSCSILAPKIAENVNKGLADVLQPKALSCTRTLILSRRSLPGCRSNTAYE